MKNVIGTATMNSASKAGMASNGMQRTALRAAADAERWL